MALDNFGTPMVKGGARNLSEQLMAASYRDPGFSPAPPLPSIESFSLPLPPLVPTDSPSLRPVPSKASPTASPQRRRTASRSRMVDSAASTPIRPPSTTWSPSPPLMPPTARSGGRWSGNLKHVRDSGDAEDDDADGGRDAAEQDDDALERSTARLQRTIADSSAEHQRRCRSDSVGHIERIAAWREGDADAACRAAVRALMAAGESGLARCAALLDDPLLRRGPRRVVLEALANDALVQRVVLLPRILAYVLESSAPTLWGAVAARCGLALSVLGGGGRGGASIDLGLLAVAQMGGDAAAIAPQLAALLTRPAGSRVRDVPTLLAWALHCVGRRGDRQLRHIARQRDSPIASRVAAVKGLTLPPLPRQLPERSGGEGGAEMPRFGARLRVELDWHDPSDDGVASAGAALERGFSSLAVVE